MTKPALKRFQILVNGEWRDPASGRWIPSVNPATEQAWCEIPNCGEDDVNAAVEAAHAALSGPWADSRRNGGLFPSGFARPRSAQALRSRSGLLPGRDPHEGLPGPYEPWESIASAC